MRRNPCLEALVQAAEHEGVEYRIAEPNRKSGRFQVCLGGTWHSVSYPHTGSDWRGAKNQAAHLRRLIRSNRPLTMAGDAA